MRKLLAAIGIGISLLPGTASAQLSGGLNDYVRGTTGSGYYPITSVNQTPGATLSSQSTGVPGSVQGYTPLEPLTTFNKGRYESFADYLDTMYRLAITIGALIAVVMLVTGGVRYMLSESFTNKDAARSRIINAVWGLTILVGSFLILYTINPNLLNFKLLIPELKQQGTSGSSAATGGTAGTSGSSQANSCRTACPANYYCDTISGTCLNNAFKETQAKAEACASQNGVWRTETFSQYCWLNKLNTEASCTQAGGTWYDPSYVLAPYCYKQ